MKKTNMIEIMVYLVLIVFGTVALFCFQPKEMEFEIPKQFEVNKVEGEFIDDTIFIQ